MVLRLAVYDYPLVVAGLRAVLEPFRERVHVVEMNANSAVLVDVDVVLQGSYGNTDLTAPDLRAGGHHRPRLAIFSWDLEASQVQAAMANGADAYLSKMLGADELIDALERVHRGEQVVPDLARDLEESQVLGRRPGAEHGLSGRESEVLALICQGLSNQQISQRAYLGINTVKTYIRSAYRKIGVTTRPQAVIWAMSHGFTPRVDREVPVGR